MYTLFPAATYDGATMLHLDEEDVRGFNALPPLPQPESEDFEAPDVLATDVVTGRTWMVSRFAHACGAYAEDITESWEAFLAVEDDEGGELIGYVGVDSGMVWLGDPAYIAGKDYDSLVDTIFANQTDGVSTPLGDLGGIAVHTPNGDGFYPVLVHRDGAGRVLRLEVDFTPAG